MNHDTKQINKIINDNRKIIVTLLSIFFIFSIFPLFASASDNTLSCDADEIGIGIKDETQQVSGNILKRTSLKIEELSQLENDTDFQANIAYARTQGYIYPREVESIYYSDGSSSINFLLYDSQNNFIMVLKSFNSNRPGTYMMKLEDDGILYFNKDGGIKVNDNGTISSYDTHHSCSFGDCELACVAKKFKNPSAMELEKMITDIALKCAGAKAADALKTAYSDIKKVKCASDCVDPSVSSSKCARCVISNTAGMLPGAGCVIGLWSILGDMLEPYAECASECGADPSSYGNQCKNYQTKKVCIKNFGGVTGLDGIAGESCNDCSWEYDNAVSQLRTCGDSEECVVGAGGPECKKKPECTSDDRCVVASPSPSGGCTYTRTPGCDQPDDNVDISTKNVQNSNVQTASNFQSNGVITDISYSDVYDPKIAVLNNGFTAGIVSQLSANGEQVGMVNVNLEGLDKYTVLVIPSGGLHGIGTEKFMTDIDSFVYKGGVLVAFSQQYGSDYSSIPGGLEGFGWQQDQSCQSGSSAMTSFHPILSGQTSSVSSFNVDGFFTKWPESSKIVLTRVKNGFPVLVTYPYGTGMVMASTLYSDYSNTLHQQTGDEQILLRDMTAWLKGEKQIPSFLEKDVPVETRAASGFSNFSVEIINIQAKTSDFPEIEPGKTVVLEVNVTNKGNKTSDRLVIKVYDPSFVPSIVEVPVSIVENESQIVPIQFNTKSTSPTGIWFALYTLYSGDDVVGAGDAGSFALGVNQSDLSNFNISLTLRAPDNTIAGTKTISTFIPPEKNESVGISFNPNNRYGIWYLEYQAKNGLGQVTAKGVKMFSVSRFSTASNGWTFPGKFSFTVNSNTEDFMIGQPATFTFNIWNFGNVEKDVTVTWGAIHHVWRGVVTGGWDYGETRTITVPANGHGSFDYTLPRVVESDRLRAIFYIDGAVAGYADRGINAVNQQMIANLGINPNEFYSGDEALIRLNATNLGGFSYDLPVNLSIVDPENTVVFFNSTIVSFSPSSIESIAYNYQIPENAKPGMYRISARWNESSSWNNYQYERVISKNFVVLPIKLQLINKTLPEYIVPGTTQMASFQIQNSGSNGTVTFNLSLKDNFYTNYTISSTFSLARGNNITLDFSIPVNASEYIDGNKYILSYTDGTMNGRKEYLSKIDVIYDMLPSYRQAENLTFNATVLNTGKVAEIINANFSVPDLSFQYNSDLNLYPGNKSTRSFSIPIPGETVSGAYDIVTRIGDKEYITQFYISPASLQLSLIDTEYSAGENITLSIENSGGNGTLYDLNIPLMDPKGYMVVDISETDLWIGAGEYTNRNLTIPDQATSGKYYLTPWVDYDGKYSDLLKTLNITGLEAVIGVETDKKIYLDSDDKIVLSSITNGNKELVDGNLHLEITGQSGNNNGTWERHDLPINAPNFETIEFDDYGNLWLGSSRDKYGVLKYSKGKYEKYTNPLEDGVQSLTFYGNTIYAAAYRGPGVAMLNTEGASTLTTTNSGLPNDEVYFLDADSQGIWINTRDGLSRFDSSGWAYYNLSNTGIWNFYGHTEADNNGGVWIGGGSDYNHFNGDTWETYNSTNTNNNILGQLHKIKVDNYGNTYFMGLTSMGYPTNIVKFDGTNWTKVPDVCSYSEWFGSGMNYIADIDVAPDGTLWSACETDGAYSLNTTGRFHFTKSNSGLPTNTLTAVRADADKVVFGAKEILGYMSFNMLISIYNGTWIDYSSSNSNIPSRNQPWNSNLISAIEISQDGTIWIGHKDGLSKLEDGMFVNYYNSGAINSNDIYSIQKSPNGDMWFGGYRSIDKFNGSWSGFSSKDSFVPNGLSPKALLVDSTGRLWVGTADYGILMYNGTGWTQYYYTDSNLNDVNFVVSGDISNEIMLLAQDSSGAIIAVDDRAHKLIFDENSWSLQSSDNSVCIPTQVIIDSSDNLWFIDEECNNGIVKWDTAYDETKYLQDENVDLLAIDGSGRIWAGGLNRNYVCIPGEEGCTSTYSIQLFVQDGAGWTKFESENFGSSLNQLYQMKFDETGRLWITTSSGLFSFTPGTGTGPSGVLWNEDVTYGTLLSGEKLASEIDAGTLGNAVGKFVLQGTLTSSTGQVIAENKYNFYVIPGDTSLETELNKKIYRPDENVVFKGKATNFADISLENAMISIEVDGDEEYSESGITIPKGGNFEFQIDLPTKEGSHSIMSQITQGGTVLAEIFDDYSVSEPSIEAEVTIPEVVGMAPFSIDVMLNNTGEVNASVNVDTGDSSQSASLMPGEIQLLRFETQINETKTIYLNYSGDLNENDPYFVEFGESVNISLNPSKVYLPGNVIVPYIVENNGLLDVHFNLTFDLSSINETQEIFLPAGENLTSTLQYDLTAGEYTIGYSSIYGSNNSTFTVAPGGAQIRNLTLTEAEGAIIVNGTIGNPGGEGFAGNVRLNSEIYINESALDIDAGEETNVSYFIDTSEVSEGNYSLTLEVLEDGNEISNRSVEIHLAPNFEFSPQDPMEVSLGENNIIVNVTNHGTAAGFAEVNMTLQGIGTYSNSSWIFGGDKKGLSFNVLIPEDLEEKSYKMFYEFNGIRSDSTFFVDGIKISVDANLDKYFYTDGEDARLSLTVNNMKDMDLIEPIAKSILFLIS